LILLIVWSQWYFSHKYVAYIHLHRFSKSLNYTLQLICAIALDCPLNIYLSHILTEVVAQFHYSFSRSMWRGSHPAHRHLFFPTPCPKWARLCWLGSFCGHIPNHSFDETGFFKNMQRQTAQNFFCDYFSFFVCMYSSIFFDCIVSQLHFKAQGITCW